MGAALLLWAKTPGILVAAARPHHQPSWARVYSTGLELRGGASQEQEASMATAGSPATKNDPFSHLPGLEVGHHGVVCVWLRVPVDVGMVQCAQTMGKFMQRTSKKSFSVL